MSQESEIFTRKNDHIRINLDEDVRSGLTSGLEHVHLEHCALPEISLDEIDLSTRFLGYDIKLPFFISSMTGGTKESDRINIHLAEAAQEMQIPIGLGSQRVALEKKAESNSFQLRNIAPDIPIFANIGAVQLNYGVGLPDCQKLIELSSADALILHLNPLQEALQPEGNINFHDLLPKIDLLCRKLSVPVIIKEVGWGISPSVALNLKNAGVSAIDIAGAGGTSWSQVEYYRTANETDRRISAQFADWGIPTAKALKDIVSLDLGIPLIASGGLGSGMDVAKCLALGADLCGLAGKFLNAGVKSTEAVVEVISELKQELQITLFACGAPNLPSLKKVGISYRE
jgi:isopentenyl-diphosphate delta-isomerase